MISIIIPTYNRANMLPDTLRSLLAQSYKNWECIIVDDGSTDGTDFLLSKYNLGDKRIKYYKRPETEKSGPSSCRNFGFGKSAGDYIHFMDSDDEYFAEALSTYMESVASGADVVVAEVELVDYKTGLTIRKNKICSPDLIEDYLQGKISFYVSGPFWKRKFLKKQQQLFDPEIRNLDDWDFNLRMLYNNPTINYIQKPLIKYRKHDFSLSFDISRLCMKEVKSEFNARSKHIRLLKQNKKAKPSLLKNFIKKRYKYFARETFVQNDKRSFYFLRKLIIIQLELKDFYGIQRSILGYLSFSLFDKGYKFFN